MFSFFKREKYIHKWKTVILNRKGIKNPCDKWKKDYFWECRSQKNSKNKGQGFGWERKEGGHNYNHYWKASTMELYCQLEILNQLGTACFTYSYTYILSLIQFPIIVCSQTCKTTTFTSVSWIWIQTWKICIKHAFSKLSNEVKKLLDKARMVIKSHQV